MMHDADIREFERLGVYGKPGTWKFRLTSFFFFMRIICAFAWCAVTLVVSLLSLALAAVIVWIFVWPA